MSKTSSSLKTYAQKSMTMLFKKKMKVTWIINNNKKNNKRNQKEKMMKNSILEELKWTFSKKEPEKFS